jgi:hypothetical protein
MSELVPEVGDVWELQGQLISIITVGKKYNKEYTFALMKLREEIVDVKYTVSYIKSVGTYLGKSKANINQLFEVDDERKE